MPVFGLSHVTWVLKLHGQISPRSFSLVPSLKRHGQSLRPCFFSFSNTPLIMKSTCCLSGFSLNLLFFVKFSHVCLSCSGFIVPLGSLLLLCQSLHMRS